MMKPSMKPKECLANGILKPYIFANSLCCQVKELIEAGSKNLCLLSLLT